MARFFLFRSLLLQAWPAPRSNPLKRPPTGNEVGLGFVERLLPSPNSHVWRRDFLDERRLSWSSSARSLDLRFSHDGEDFQKSSMLALIHELMGFNDAMMVEIKGEI